mmetsp:Transcript_19497/g.29328  ORF Transcript_19497/g.29328 Transcript_19497/m.29328 type:complete len:340 (-) Transcript_19497:159-1178(-)
MASFQRKNQKSKEATKIKQETRPPSWKVWMSASRPHTLSASLAPCLVGYSAASTTLPNFPELNSLFCRWLLFCVFIQLATNLHNDYADWVKGADTHERVGQARATQKGWLSPQETASAATAALLVAFFIGLSMMPPGGDKIFWFVLLSSCFNAVAYTGGPYPLGFIGFGNVSIAYWGLGDVFCFLYFGLVAVLTIPYLVLSNQEVPWEAMVDMLKPSVLQSLPASFLSTAIIVVNNLRDRHTDVLAQKRTLAVRFGALFCKFEYSFLVLLSYLSALFSMFHYSSLWQGLPFLTTFLAAKGINAMWTLEGRELNPFVGKTAMLELSFCFLQCIGMFFSGS